MKRRPSTRTALTILTALSLATAALTAEPRGDAPRLVKHGDTRQLVVDGKPFLVLGGGPPAQWRPDAPGSAHPAATGEAADPEGPVLPVPVNDPV